MRPRKSARLKSAPISAGAVLARAQPVKPSVLAGAALTAIGTLVVFLPALKNHFVNWDDYVMLVNNPAFRGFGWTELRWMFTTFHMGHYQPLSWMSFALDYLVWGMDPTGYHLTNLLLHTANAVEFFFLAHIILRLAWRSQTGEHPLSLMVGAVLAALLFSVHPLRVESVAWATERRDVLSGLFYLLALHAYLLRQTATDLPTRRRHLAVSIAAYTLSLLSKGTAMTLPVVLVILDVYPLRRLPGNLMEWTRSQYRRVWAEKVPFIILAAVFALIALMAQQTTGALRPVQQYFLSYRLGQLFYSIWFYLWKTLLPLNLSPLYELPFDFDAWMPVFGFCAVAVITITGALYLFRRRWPAGLAAWTYYLVVLAPVAGVAQSGPQLVADRYSYLSCLSWALLIGGGAAYLWNRQGIRILRRSRLAPFYVGAFGILMVLATMTWQQTKIWQDTRTLWLHVIAIEPNSSIAHYNLGKSYEDDGNAELSLKHYRRAVENNPANADARYNLARQLAAVGAESEAERHYRTALKIRPADSDARNNLGLLLARRGETDAALEQFRNAVESDPRYGKAYFNIGRILATRNDLTGALENYRRALELHPNEGEILAATADVLARQGRHEEAARHLRAAIAREPGRVEARVALARVLAALGRKEEAEQEYQQALKQLQKSQPHSPAGVRR